MTLNCKWPNPKFFLFLLFLLAINKSVHAVLLPLPINPDGSLQLTQVIGPYDTTRLSVGRAQPPQPSPALRGAMNDMAQLRHWDNTCLYYERYTHWAKDLTQNSVDHAREAIRSGNWENVGTYLDEALRAYQATKYGQAELIRLNSGRINVPYRTTSVNHAAAQAEAQLAQIPPMSGVASQLIGDTYFV